MTSTSTLQQRYHAVRRELDYYAQLSGKRIRLVLVSKTQPLDKIKQFYRMGHRVFGESYAQELIEKTQDPELTGSYWIFIGRLQSNKLKKIVLVSNEIQSVSSLKHFELINRYAGEFNKNPFPVYLLVNAEEEPQKEGVSMENVLDIAENVTENHPFLDLRGLMAIPSKKTSLSAQTGEVPPIFHRLRQLASKLKGGELSLGMSSDYVSALQAGSQCLRLGSFLFGERKKNNKEREKQ